MSEYIENIIIGSGPAGLQLGYYFEKEGIKYIILEKEGRCGSFFEKYPHSGELISINKKYTGSNNEEFNLRHDWNSLLNDYKLKFGDYTDDYYPKREDLQKYLCDFREYYKINVKYNKNVLKVKKKNGIFYILCKDGGIYSCKKLIIATGLMKKNIPDIKNIEYARHYGDYERDYFKNNLERYKNKNVLIIGNGNSAFELGSILTGVCASVLIVGRDSVPKPAFITHYTGSVRSKYMSFHDTFLLKSLNAYSFLRQGGGQDAKIRMGKDKKYYLSHTCDCDCDYFTSSLGFDEVINCTGWGFDDSIFDMKIDMNGKYPKLNSRYGSSNIENLYFVGALMHGKDYMRSSGGFIHGFRYLIDNFVKMNYIGCKEIILDEVVGYIISRINVSSGLYQMHGELVDIFYKVGTVYKYYEQVSLEYMLNKLRGLLFYSISLEYNYNNKEYDIRKVGTATAYKGMEGESKLIHPILRVYSESGELVDVYHFEEDLFADFRKKSVYEDRLKRILGCI